MKETENHVIEYLSPLELKPYDKNARKHSERQINALISSVEKFGFTLPLLIDKDCGVIAGHARLEAAIQLRFTRVPCIRLSRFTEEQRAAYIIADNKLGELSEWDEEILRSELLRLKDMGLELITLGFSEKEIDSLSLGGEFERDAAEDALPELSEEAVTQAGDLWLLGEHRLICGDSTDARIVERLLDMVTDPPYGVNYDPKWREAAHHGGRLKNGLVMNDDRSDWREAWSLFAGDVAYVWHGANHVLSVAESLLIRDFRLRTMIVWVKDRHVLSRGDYHWQHESCWYAVREKKKSHWSGGRKQSTVWPISYSGQDMSTAHSTRKPVECMRKPIFNNSMPGDAVYEPFCGSGTTLIAAQSLKRRCYAVELDPRYVDMTVARWEKYTGKKAARVKGN